MGKFRFLFIALLMLAGIYVQAAADPRIQALCKAKLAEAQERAIQDGRACEFCDRLSRGNVGINRENLGQLMSVLQSGTTSSPYLNQGADPSGAELGKRLCQLAVAHAAQGLDQLASDKELGDKLCSDKSIQAARELRENNICAGTHLDIGKFRPELMRREREKQKQCEAKKSASAGGAASGGSGSDPGGDKSREVSSQFFSVKPGESGARLEGQDSRPQTPSAAATRESQDKLSTKINEFVAKFYQQGSQDPCAPQVGFGQQDKLIGSIEAALQKEREACKEKAKKVADGDACSLLIDPDKPDLAAAREKAKKIAGANAQKLRDMKCDLSNPETIAVSGFTTAIAAAIDRDPTLCIGYDFLAHQAEALKNDIKLRSAFARLTPLGALASPAISQLEAQIHDRVASSYYKATFVEPVVSKATQEAKSAEAARLERDIDTALLVAPPVLGTGYKVLSQGARRVPAVIAPATTAADAGAARTTQILGREITAAERAAGVHLEPERLQEAQRLLGRPLSPSESIAIREAHLAQTLDEKARILKSANISEAERRILIEGYVAGDVPPINGMRSPYISFDTGSERLAGRVLGKNRDGNYVVEVFNSEGQRVRHVLSPEEVRTVRESTTARLGLERVSGTRADDINGFRDALNSQRFEGDKKFISYLPEGARSPEGARIVGMTDKGLEVEVIHNGKVERKILSSEDLLTARFSQTSKLNFDRYPAAAAPIRAVEPAPIYEFKSVKVADYQTRGGQRIAVDFKSPQLQEHMRDAQTVYQQHGVQAISQRTPTAAELERASNAWLQYARNIESKGSGSAYEQGRNNIIAKGGGVGDLGEIAACQAAVCRELSLFASVSFAELGISSRVVKGNVRGGGHAWVEFLDSRGNVIGLVDSNYTRKFYRNYEDYYREVQARPIDYTIVASPR